MKIAFIGGRDIKTLGGIENYVYNLATHLAKLGHEPIVYCESNRNAIEEVNGFKVIYHKSFGGRFLCKILLSLKSTIDALTKEESVELFHYNAWPPSLWSWIPRMVGRKALLEGHGFEWKRTKYSPFQQKIMHLMEWLTAKMHKNILVVSDEQRDYFASHYSRSCVTIPTAVNMPDSNDIDSDILSRYKVEQGRYFLYLGRLVQDKNPDYLIKAFQKANTTDYKLVIAGSNDQQPEYVEYLHKLAQSDSNIIFTGAVYGADKNTLLRHSAAFCIPSTIEGLAITLLEAMSYGLVCIASDIPSNREGLSNNGIWVKAEDVDSLAEKIEYVINNRDALSHIKELNRRRVEQNFTWDIIAKRYVEYITNVCDGNHRSSYPNSHDMD
ncbi:MAG: glycosyltransferase family 4 protein [Alistipes sp.]|nr:glycosyltransferase family 4 protein [Alistipes sp.]